MKKTLKRFYMLLAASSLFVCSLTVCTQERNFRAYLFNKTNMPIELCSMNLESCGEILPGDYKWDGHFSLEKNKDRDFEEWKGHKAIKMCGKIIPFNEIYLHVEKIIEEKTLFRQQEISIYNVSLSQEAYDEACEHS